jgi:excisionase family DNA binding protein
MPARALGTDVVEPSPQEEKRAKRLLERITSASHLPSSAKLLLPNGEAIPLPKSALSALIEVVAAMARGDAVAVVPVGHELTTQQAADLIGVSRPYLIRLLDFCEIPFHRVGTHRRIMMKDILDYRRRRDLARRRALRQLTRTSEDLGLYSE